jgi:hypothetical protein
VSENFQTVWEGFEALQSLGEHAPIPALASTAKDLHDRLARSARGGPIVAFIATRGESVAPDEAVLLPYLFQAICAAFKASQEMAAAGIKPWTVSRKKRSPI